MHFVCMLLVLSSTGHCPRNNIQSCCRPLSGPCEACMLPAVGGMHVLSTSCRMNCWKISGMLVMTKRLMKSYVVVQVLSAVTVAVPCPCSCPVKPTWM